MYRVILFRRGCHNCYHLCFIRVEKRNHRTYHFYTMQSCQDQKVVFYLRRGDRPVGKLGYAVNHEGATETYILSSRSVQVQTPRIAVPRDKKQGYFAAAAIANSSPCSNVTQHDDDVQLCYAMQVAKTAKKLFLALQLERRAPHHRITRSQPSSAIQELGNMVMPRFKCFQHKSLRVSGRDIVPIKVRCVSIRPLP